ncbi:hypothetical protein PG993_005351 [Apiospora rasikravindrae]|uniref:Uncharacterized protein n=1 Tax=Apiospora rasikravindrae TaxID=990691 RepID=A0ABR1TFF6_9PEZI
MQPGLYSTAISLHFVLLLTFSTFIDSCSSAPSVDQRDKNNRPGLIHRAEDGPSLSSGALADPSYLPAQIGGIVGAYALSLVIVAALLLLLSKKRRQHLAAADEEEELDLPYPFAIDQAALDPNTGFPYPLQSPKSPIKNFSRPTPAEEKEPTPYIFPSSSPTSTTLGINPLVDQRVVKADHEMAQQQLEEMYKYVMEQEEAKAAGVKLQDAPAPILKSPPPSSAAPPASILKKGKNKPANLDLAKQGPEKKESRASSLLSALKSPRKKAAAKGLSISSPIMTPMSGAFPRQEGEEMERIPPRQYAPAAPPPVPSDQQPYYDPRAPRTAAPMTPPDNSPESTLSIDERLEAQMASNSYYGHSRNVSQATYDQDPSSATTDRSTTPLVGLPSSPKPGVNRFPSLPASPKPGATFSRPNAPSAVRTGGALPLRAYEPSLASPSMQTTKQTVFERAPLSPSGLRTPWTGAPVPYTPYQPQTPCIPVTPSLVTKADRKRMKSMNPKTPTLEMVKSSDEIW